MQEEWTRWYPTQNISGRYYIDYFGISEEWDLVIKLSNEDDTQKIEIIFCTDAYRYTNESFCFGVFGDLSKKYGDNFYSNWSFFKITNSEYLKWIGEKSYGHLIIDFEFIHFCIVGGDEMIDILARNEPTIKLI